MRTSFPIVLAIETSTSSCSVALRVQGEVKLQAQVGSNIHSRILLDEIDKLLKSSNIDIQDLDAVAVSQGPGSFTGLRIGIGVAQGIAFGANCPLIGVPTLTALAANYTGCGPVLAAIDARMSEVYWQIFETKNAVLEPLTPPTVCAPEQVAKETEYGENKELAVIGNPWQEYQDRWPEFLKEKVRNAIIDYPDAAGVLRIAEEKYERGDTNDARFFEAIYVREKVAEKPKK